MLLRKRRSDRLSSSSSPPGKALLFGSLTAHWRQHYVRLNWILTLQRLLKERAIRIPFCQVDLGHCRLAKCSRRLLSSSSSQLAELRDSSQSFCALAIAAAAACGAAKEPDVCKYVEAAISCGLRPNDEHGGNSSVVQAAYAGFTRVLRILLDAGCELDGRGPHGHAILAAVRNGKHAALEVLVEHPDAKRLVTTDGRSHNPAHPWRTPSVLFVALQRRCVESVRLLHERGGAALSDHDFVCMSVQKMESSFHLILATLQSAPPLPLQTGAAGSPEDVRRWSKALHWTFPSTDRHALNLLWHTFQRPTVPAVVLQRTEHGRRPVRKLRRPLTLPADLWLHVFSFVERGWWASREYFARGRPWNDVCIGNILLDAQGTQGHHRAGGMGVGEVGGRGLYHSHAGGHSLLPSDYDFQHND
jgi:hypothetical protein